MVGDTDSAERELDDLAREIDEFNRTEAEASLTLSSRQASQTLREMEARLARFDLSSYDADLRVEAEGALAEVRALQLELAALDARDVDVDIETSRDLDVLGQTVQGITERLVEAGDAAADAGGSFGGLGVRVGGLSGSFASLGPVAIAAAAVLGVALVAAAGSAVTAIAALTAAAAAALAALGALAVGFSSLLAPAIALGVGAFQRFKKQSDEAGSAAHGLKQAGEDLADLFTRTLGPASDAVFRGLTAAIKAISPTLRSLRGEFRVFGQAVGDALRLLGEEFSSPRWREFFEVLIEWAAKAAGPVTRVLIQVFRIMRDIAQAALPFVIEGFRLLAGALRGVRENMGGVQSIRDFLRDAIPYLESFWELFKAVGSVMLEFFKAAAPFGKELVDWLAQGARELANWLRSAEGQEKVKQFFEDTIPVVKSLVSLLAQLFVAFMQFFQAAAPGLKALLDGLNAVVGAVRSFLSFLNQLPEAARTGFVFGPVIGGAIELIKGLADAAGNLGRDFNRLVGIAQSAWNGIKNSITGSVERIKNFLSTGWETIRGAATGSWETLKNRARADWDRVRDFITSSARNARQTLAPIWDGIRDNASNSWDRLKSIASSSWDRVREFITSNARNARQALPAIWDAIKTNAQNSWDRLRELADSAWERIRSFITDRVRGARETLGGLWDAIRDNASGSWDRLKEMAQGAWDAIRERIVSPIRNGLDAIKSLGESFFNAGINLVEQLASGIANAAVQAVNRLRDLAGRLRDVLPGSEPRDRTSPLRGLADRGAAIVENLAEGILDEARVLPEALAVAVDHRGIDLSPVPALAGAGAVGAPVTQHEHYYIPQTPAGGPPDPAVVAAQLAVIKRQRRR